MLSQILSRTRRLPDHLNLRASRALLAPPPLLSDFRQQMIQRVQSLFLLFAALLVGAFLTIGDVWRTVVVAVYPWVGPLTLALGGIVVVASLVAVFLYKDRQVQRKVVLLAQVVDLILVLLLVGVMVVVNLRPDLLWEPVAMQTAYITALLPFGAYVFLRLARHGIEKDIALVKSVDRLR